MTKKCIIKTPAGSISWKESYKCLEKENAELEEVIRKNKHDIVIQRVKENWTKIKEICKDDKKKIYENAIWIVEKLHKESTHYDVAIQENRLSDAKKKMEMDANRGNYDDAIQYFEDIIINSSVYVASELAFIADADRVFSECANLVASR